MSTTHINEPTEQSAKQVAIQLGGEVLLRDYFAAKAMQGMLSDANAVDEETGNKLSIPDNAELIATASYMMANAMLKAREA